MLKKVCKQIKRWKNACTLKWKLAVATVDYDQGNYEKACPVFEKFAERGVIGAQDLCGDCYYHGTEEAMGKALYWSEKAAVQGNWASQLRCVKIYSYGSHKNLKKAEHWFHTALTTQEEFPATEAMNAHLGLFLGWAENVFQDLGLNDAQRAELQARIEELVTAWHQPFKMTL